MKPACLQVRGVVLALLLGGGLVACDDPVKPQGKGATLQAGSSLATDRRVGVFGNDVAPREGHVRLNSAALGASDSTPSRDTPPAASASAPPAVDYRLTER